LALPGGNCDKSRIAELLGARIGSVGPAQMVLGTPAAQLFGARTAFLGSLTGALLIVGGTRVVKILAFPLFRPTFMFPIPAIVYARVTLPLLLFESSIAETF